MFNVVPNTVLDTFVPFTIVEPVEDELIPTPSKLDSNLESPIVNVYPEDSNVLSAPK